MFKKIFKSILTQSAINNLYHRPKAILANIRYGFPGRNIKIIGVTGTDGKTTTTNMIYQILKAAGKKVSMVSTINAVIGGRVYDTGFHVTSPDSLMVQKFARGALDHKDEYLALEVTSHALDQYRFWGIKFDAGVVTNVTHEHLDYHKTYKNYLNTKLKLIRDTRFAVVNENIRVDGEVGLDLIGVGGKIITFGLNKGDFNQHTLKLKLQIPGDYNIENALAAFAVCDSLGIDQSVIRKSLQGFDNLTGRMQSVKNKRGIKIIIDFAHTPNGFENALRTLRTRACFDDSARRASPWRLIAVFGSAGKRDVGKRALMGSIAVKLADIAVVTSEDPRGELEIINRQIVDGAKKVGGVIGENIFVIPDRGEAIDFAVNTLAKKGDTVGIFGKGHESSMNLDGKTEIPWSDKKAVEEVLGSSSGYNG